MDELSFVFLILMCIGVASGFRESGINLGKKRALVAIRTGANSLEVSADGISAACPCAD